MRVAAAEGGASFQRGTGAGMARHKVRYRDPRTLDVIQGFTTAVLVGRSIGASRGTAQAGSANRCERCPRKAVPVCLARDERWHGRHLFGAPLFSLTRQSVQTGLG